MSTSGLRPAAAANPREARSEQRKRSGASIAISLTRAAEDATVGLLATLTHFARLRAALNLEHRRCRRIRAEIERFDLEQVALSAVHGQLGYRETVPRMRPTVLRWPWLLLVLANAGVQRQVAWTLCWAGSRSNDAGSKPSAFFSSA